MPSYTDLMNMLPYRLRSRFDSLSAYVKAVIDEELRLRPTSTKLRRADVQQIQLLVFVWFLNTFFREGTAAARSAVAGFKTLGVDGFTVGATVFEGENKNVRMGESLSDDLVQALSGATRIRSEAPAGADLILNWNGGLRELVIALMSEVIRGKLLD